MNYVIVRNRVLQVGDLVRVGRCYGTCPLPYGLAAGTIATVRRTGFGFAEVADQRGFE